MPSFIVIKTPPRKHDQRSLQTSVNRLSVYRNEDEYRQGTLPDTFKASHGCVYFEIGVEYRVELRKLEGMVDEKLFKSFEVAFVGESFVAVEKASAEELDWVQRFLERNFVQGVVLDPIPFEEKVLRKVIERNPDVFQIEHEPSSRGNETVDKLTLTGRGVTKSRLYEEHGDEPLRKVKVRLSELTGVTVSFFKDGKLTIMGESDIDRLLAVLKVIVDRMIAPFAATPSYQRRLSFE